MTSPLVPRRPAPPQRSFQAALVLPGLAAVAALVAGYLSGGISVTEQAGFVSSVPHGLVTLLGALVAVLLVAGGLVVTRLRRRFDEDRLHSAALAVTDELTGVGTRRFVMERLEDELGRARRYQRKLSCALIDVDGLARVNDAVGVDAGDAVLRGAAGAVRAQLRRSDSVGRLRDDELLVVLPETDEAGARVISERLRQAVASLQVLHAGLTLQATVSLGVTTYVPGQEREPPGPEALLRRADEALFRAKAAGRNRVA